MTTSYTEVPHFHLTSEAWVGDLLAWRTRFNREASTRVSLNDLLIKACALALREVPEVNASYVEQGAVRHRDVDVAVAVAIPGGLVTPIIRRADTKAAQDIALEMKDLAERARCKTLKPNEYYGGGFTISNLGMFGVSSFTSIINQPQSCILSVGGVSKRYRFRGEEPFVADVMNLTLNCDHRLINGALAARWIETLIHLLATPEAWAC